MNVSARLLALDAQIKKLRDHLDKEPNAFSIDASLKVLENLRHAVLQGRLLSESSTR